MAAAANATNSKIGTHLVRREFMLGLISKFHAGTWKGMKFETTRPSSVHELQDSQGRIFESQGASPLSREEAAQLRDSFRA